MECDAGGRCALPRVRLEGATTASAAVQDTGPDGISVDELATVLCGWDAADAGAMRTPSDRNQLLIALRHVHLPSLDDAGLVEYDRSAGRVAPRPLDPRVEELLERSVAAESLSRE
ncbi:hypothetical protein ACFQFH_00405 [Halobaculum halobium]|uniref:DUF7344 domain-containing protein n=1 Tax=Halobaculum halobium TaxID=3032281 RepID=UPI00360FC6E9